MKILLSNLINQILITKFPIMHLTSETTLSYNDRTQQAADINQRGTKTHTGALAGGGGGQLPHP